MSDIKFERILKRVNRIIGYLTLITATLFVISACYRIWSIDMDVFFKLTLTCGGALLLTNMAMHLLDKSE